MSIVPLLLNCTTRRRFNKMATATAKSASTTLWNDKWTLENVSKIKGVIVESILPLPEWNIIGIKGKCAKSGANLLHLATKQEECRAMAISFKTQPRDSTGAPHILEHTVLCGSKKFPVKDPFFKMLDRSLSFYMNAWTASDWTMYPFCVGNATDWKNLRAIYTDAVFSPLLEKQDFQQEGWRIEDGQIKGIVFNEMKGALWSDGGEAMFHQSLQENILPGTTYSHCSGGDPLHIPRLSHQALKEFHQKFYSPSNSLFLSYGGGDVEELKEHWEWIGDELSGAKSNVVGDNNDNNVQNINNVEATKSSLAPSTGTKQNLSTPMDGFIPLDGEKVVSNLTCPIDPSDPEGKLCRISFSFLTPEDLQSLQDKFNLSIISSILLDGPSSPMHKALLGGSDSNNKFGKDYMSITGFDSSYQRPMVNIALQGVPIAFLSNDDGQVIRDCIMETIKMVIASPQDNGFDSKRVESHLDQLAISRQTDRGLESPLFFFQTLASTWAHAEPSLLGSLELEGRVASFKRSIKEDPSFVAEMLRKLFTDNTNILRTIQRPSLGHQNVLLEKEEELRVSLLEQQHKASEEDQNVVNGAAAVAAGDDDGKECLPILEEQEIPKSSNLIGFSKFRSCDDTTADTTTTATAANYTKSSPLSNSLLYWRAKVPLKGDFDISLLPLLLECIEELGPKGRDYGEWESECKSLTGSSMSVSVVNDWNEANVSSLMFSSKCLKEKWDNMFTLWKNTLANLNWSNVGRLRQLVESKTSGSMMDIGSNGHSYAKSLASALLFGPSSSQWRDEVCGGHGLLGVSVMKLLEKSLSSTTSAYENLAKSLCALSERLLSSIEKNSISVSIISSGDGDCDDDRGFNESVIIKTSQEFLKGLPDLLPKNCFSTNNSDNDKLLNLPKAKTPTSKKVVLSLPFQTCFASKVCRVMNESTCLVSPEKDSLKERASWTLLCKIISSQFLHKEIREKGGAYGGGVGFDCHSGTMAFYTYRDPNPLMSMETFAKSFKWFMDGDVKTINARHVLEAKLSIIGAIDKPTKLGSQGLGLQFHSITDEWRQLYRDQLLSVTLEDLKNLCSLYLSRPVKEVDEAMVVLCGDDNSSLKAVDTFVTEHSFTKMKLEDFSEQ